MRNFFLLLFFKMKKLNISELLESVESSEEIVTLPAGNSSNSLSISVRSLIVSCLTIYAFRKLLVLARQYYLEWYAKLLSKYYESQHSELVSVKQYLIRNRLNKLKDSRTLPIHIVELGYCGSNFDYFPSYSILTICNCYPEMKPHIRAKFKSYERKLWLLNRSLNTQLSQLSSESIDVLVCTHYLCSCSENFQQIMAEIYRVLKPVNFLLIKTKFGIKVS